MKQCFSAVLLAFRTVTLKKQPKIHSTKELRKKHSNSDHWIQKDSQNGAHLGLKKLRRVQANRPWTTFLGTWDQFRTPGSPFS